MANTWLLNPYPTDMGEPAKVLLAKIKGEAVPVPTLVHAAYQFTGCGLNQFLPDDNSVHAAAQSGASEAGGQTFTAHGCDEEKAKEALEKLSQPGKRGLLDNVLLKQALAYAFSILQKYLLNGELPS